MRCPVASTVGGRAQVGTSLAKKSVHRGHIGVIRYIMGYIGILERKVETTMYGYNRAANIRRLYWGVAFIQIKQVRASGS